MEFGALLVFLAVFAGCGAVVFIISFFGTQTETYEEALEKQKNKLNKEKAQKKEKKPAAEKKKKSKKAKEIKNNNIMEFEEDTVLVDPSGEVVEPVYIEPAVQQPKEEVVVKAEKPKKEEKKKKEEKITAKAIVAPTPVVVVEEDVPVQAAAPKATEVVEAEVAAPEPVAVVKEQPKPVKKMEIKTVESVKEDVEEKKKKKPSKEKGKKKSNYDEVLETVRRVQLSNTEAQGIVDVLLLKQTSFSSDNDADGEWVEPGKETEAKKMTRQLAEVTEQLDEEKNKSSGLEKKMASVRKEMTDGKSQLNVLKREIEEVNRKKVLETNNYNTTVQQLKVELNTSQTYNIQMEAKYQTEMRNIKEQLERAQVAASPSDSKLVAELETIKSENVELSNTNSSLHHKFTQKCSEVDSATASLQQQLSDLRAKTGEEKDELSSQLTKAQEVQAQLEIKLEAASAAQPDASAQVASNQLESQLSAISAAKHQLQSELTTLKEKLSEKEVENSRIMEENERLSEQVASSVERPAAEGEEAVSVNGHSEVQHQPQMDAVKEVPVISADMEEKYSKITIQLKQRESRCEELEAELSNSKLDFQKLNSKNDSVSAEYDQYKAECMTLLGNLFPAVECSQDLATIQTKAAQFIQDLEKRAEEASKVDSLTEDIQKLETQSASYKTILAQTENMLTTLQASVEGAEQEWKKKFEASESECKELKSKVTELESKNTELLEKFKDASSLSEELAAEKSGKDLLAKKCSELQHLLAVGEKQLELANTQEEVLTNGGGESEA